MFCAIVVEKCKRQLANDKKVRRPTTAALALSGSLSAFGAGGFNHY
jgi:hypothetical protein